jgi:hypothetical protein
VGELDGCKFLDFCIFRIVKFEIFVFSLWILVFLKSVGVCVIPPFDLLVLFLNPSWFSFPAVEPRVERCFFSDHLERFRVSVLPGLRSEV